MTTIKKIATLSMALTIVFFTSCEKEEFQVDSIEKPILEPTPIAFDKLESKTRSVSTLAQAKSETIITWAAIDGYYYEKTGNTIHGNPNTGDTEKYNLQHEGINFTYISSVSSGRYIALPNSGINTLRTSYVYNFTKQSWVADKKFRYSIQKSDDDFRIYYSNIDEDRIRFGWYIGSSSTYADYRYDIFVDGVKIKENHTFSAAGHYFSINSLKENTTYSIKIVAKDQGNDAKLKIKNFSVKTPKKILISDFDFKVSNITKRSVTLSWTIPDITHSSAAVEKFSLSLASNRLGAFLGNTVGVDTEVIINFTFNESGEITGFISPETVGHGSSTPGYTQVFSKPIPKSTLLTMDVTAIVPSNNPNEPYYTEYKRVIADPIQLLQ
ncbi:MULTISPECIES: hypothetical protein [Aquimarina]|uniref:hypothetical protein n=1 Tax=Aquimarina TaxID=290174 RepID=UPI0009447441|nr:MULTISPECIES: hypothetical protein [Aquimarina]